MRFAAPVGWFRIERFASSPGRLVASDYLVEIRNLTYSYGDRPVLENIEMAIPRGKVVAIMGISGSGKTTILRLIGGVLAARRGEVVFDGERVNPRDREHLYSLRRRMGMLFQFGALFTDSSVFDNVAFQIREHTDLPESMVRDLVLMKLHAVGLRAAHAAMPGELSGGMARRVALARAIALDPTLMMYDEPFTGLDPIALGVTASLIRRLNGALGATSIVVTHDVEEALEIVDYVYYLSQGHIVAQGTPDEMRANPDPLVRQFVYGKADGPVNYQYPSRPIAEELAV
jgi:phospholipid/cholesterol/gamma-HCH transport system ATP-binding protein